MTPENSSALGAERGSGSWVRIVAAAGLAAVFVATMLVGTPAFASKSGSGGANMFMAWADTHTTSPHEGRSFAKHGSSESLSGWVMGHSNASATSIVSFSGSHRFEFRG